MKVWKSAVIFYLGGMLYMSIELLWRGWSHGSMFFMGGLCFWLIGGLNEFAPGMSVLTQMLLGTLIIVTAELIGGLTMNSWLGWGIWDYSPMPYHLWGQICLPFALLWFPVSGIAVLADDWLRRRLFGDPMPVYRWI